MFECTKLKQPVYPELDSEADAQFYQALELATPRGVPIDFAQVADLYQQAVDKGHWKAMNNLSILYLSGMGVDADENKAADLIMQMQRYDIPESLYSLANAYEKGIGHIKKSKRKMQQTLDQAAEFANPRALGAKGNSYMLSGDWDKLREAIPIIECAMSMGYTGDGIVSALADAYLFEGRHKDYYDTLIRGANMSDGTSLRQLEVIFRLGDEGFPVDKQRAACFDAIGDNTLGGVSYRVPDDIRTLCPANFPLPYDITGG